MTNPRITRPLIVGEVLFDCFPNRNVLGGAPLNVAWNLRGLGLDPLLVTAVGDDDSGRTAIRAISDWGLDQSGVQIDQSHPTGRVDIKLDSGEPTYQFWDDVAFDHIAFPSDDIIDRDYGLLYHGSLAMRSPESMKTILDIRRRVKCPVFVDINIRQPFFNHSWIEPLLRDADHLKLNADELRLIVKAVHHGDSAPSDETKRKDDSNAWSILCEKAQVLKKSFGVKTVWITYGERGAGCLRADGSFFFSAAPAVAKMADTVGAGDAFAAVTIQGILAGTSPDDSLSSATAFAARVCGLHGATTMDLDFYSS
ncbi:MAG TPA: carbohydrate kinase [Planctomycetaceae bacterium]|nr:carbohydrate kinase [Planctomycetaceae bacterium]